MSCASVSGKERVVRRWTAITYHDARHPLVRGKVLVESQDKIDLEGVLHEVNNGEAQGKVGKGAREGGFELVRKNIEDHAEHAHVAAKVKGDVDHLDPEVELAPGSGGERVNV